MTRPLRIFAFAIACSTLAIASAAQAAYFVRPALQYNGELIDGLSLNDATQASLSFNDGFQSFEAHADLKDGTIKTFLEMNGPNTGFGVATGVMGDRIRFTGDTGTAVDFSFDFDGVIDVAQQTLGDEPASDRFIAIQAHFAVYDSSVGATWDDWTLFGTHSDDALLIEYLSLPFDYTEASFTEYVYNSDLGGSLNLTSGRSYDVFAAFNLVVIPGSNVGPITMNFLNTGTIGIDAPSDSSFTSQSGVFLGFEQTVGGVPEPSQWALLILGFGAVGSLARRRRMTALAC